MVICVYPVCLPCHLNCLPYRRANVASCFTCLNPHVRPLLCPATVWKSFRHQLQAAAKAGQPAWFPPCWRMLESLYCIPRRAFPWDRFLSSKAIQPIKGLPHAALFGLERGIPQQSPPVCRMSVIAGLQKGNDDEGASTLPFQKTSMTTHGKWETNYK